MFQGLLFYSPATAKRKDMFIRLWVHEASLCFHDRLINDEDRAWFCDAVAEALQKTFKVHMKKEDIFGANPIVWATYSRAETRCTSS